MSLRSRPRGSMLHTCTAVQATGFPRWKMLVPGALESGAWVGLRLRYMLKSTNTVWCFSHRAPQLGNNWKSGGAYLLFGIWPHGAWRAHGAHWGWTCSL
jgi:hypothetical protein